MNTVEIANFALTLTGEKTIRGFYPTEDSVQSRMVKALLDPILKELIANHRWSFATREADLVEASGETSSLGDFVYLLPAGCLRVWDLLPEGRYGTEWQIVGQRLISSVEDASVIYTIEDAMDGPFPIWFAMCAAQQLAPTIAIAKNSVEKVHILNSAARMAKEKALITDLNQRNRVGRKDSALSDTFIRGR